MVKQMITKEYEVGALLWGPFRNLLLEIKLVNHKDVTWVEGSGILARPFYVTTEPEVHSVIRDVLIANLHKRQLDLADIERQRKEAPWWKFWI